MICTASADEIDAIGTKRYESQSGGEREIQRTMLELLNQMDGFDSMGDVKVLLNVITLKLITLYRFLAASCVPAVFNLQKPLTERPITCFMHLLLFDTI